MSMLRPLIFLDVDGVLNSTSDADEDDFYPESFEDRMRDNALRLSRPFLSNLADLVISTSADIVLSTSWRTDSKVAAPALCAALHHHGIACPIGATPDLYGISEGLFPAGVRVDEITAFVAEQEYPRRWIALDDLDLATHAPSELTGHFLLTDSESALTDGCVAEARRLLEAQQH
jgi:hypothetical protein